MLTFPVLSKETSIVAVAGLNQTSSAKIRSLMVSRRLVVMTYVAEVATDIAATAMTVNRRLLRTGVIARLSRMKLLKKCFILFASHEEPQRHVTKNHHDQAMLQTRSHRALTHFSRN